MATPAAAASITTPTLMSPLPPAPARNQDNQNPLDLVRQQLAEKGKLNSSYLRLLNGFLQACQNPVSEEQRAEHIKRMVEETQKTLVKEPVRKAAPVSKAPGIEDRVSDLMVRVNKLFGETKEALANFVNTKQIDDLSNMKAKETTPKGTEPKKVDRNRDKLDELTRKNNDLMLEFVRLYRSLNNKITSKDKLIKAHITITPSDEAALSKFTKKLYLSDKKVRQHFHIQDGIKKNREEALTNLNILNKGINDAFSTAQKELHYLLDCCVAGDIISRATWKAVGNAMLGGYKTDADRLSKIHRIENIATLIPKPVGKTIAPQSKEAVQAPLQVAVVPAAAQTTETPAAPVPAAAAPQAPVNAAAKPAGKKKKKKAIQMAGV